MAEAARTMAAAEGGQCPEAGAVTMVGATGAAAEAAHGEMKETSIHLSSSLVEKLCYFFPLFSLMQRMIIVAVNNAIMMLINEWLF